MDSNRVDKLSEMNKILNQWLYLREENDNTILSFFTQNDIKKIGILGMGNLAIHLVKELNDFVEVIYIIDKEEKDYADNITTTNKIDYEKVDAIIYTNKYEKDETFTLIEGFNKNKIFYLGDIVFGNY